MSVGYHRLILAQFAWIYRDARIQWLCLCGICKSCFRIQLHIYVCGRKISRNLEATRSGFGVSVPHWNLARVSAAVLRNHVPNFKGTQHFWTVISPLRHLMRYRGKRLFVAFWSSVPRSAAINAVPQWGYDSNLRSVALAFVGFRETVYGFTHDSIKVGICIYHPNKGRLKHTRY